MFKHTIELHERPTATELHADIATSFWLREALEESRRRDPADALRDAELLVAVLAERLNALENAS